MSLICFSLFSSQRYFSLYKTQPHILYEFLNAKTSQNHDDLFNIRYRLGHEIKNNIIKDNKSWILTEDLKELKNQFATPKLW
jgi:hypothetical protein